MKPGSVFFRADASLAMGAGHVMRCLTLADGLKAEGAECVFICREHPGNLLDMVRARGFEVHALPMGHEGEPVEGSPAHAAWLGAAWEADAAQCLALLNGRPIDWLVVDHYALDARWERQLRPACGKLMAIDDLADRPHDCDLLLDQNLGRRPGDYADLIPGHCQVLAGPIHALLRPEFAALREYSLTRRAEPRLERLLISLGGVDKDNVTARVLEALKTCTLPDNLRITVVMGARAPWVGAVRDLARDMPWATEVRVNVDDMAKLMGDSDLAIGAAGGSAWERACLGLPCLLLILADNQRPGAEALGETGGVIPLDSGPCLAGELRLALDRLHDPARMGAMGNAISRVTDGLGLDRVARAMGMEAGT